MAEEADRTRLQQDLRSRRSLRPSSLNLPLASDRGRHRVQMRSETQVIQ